MHGRHMHACALTQTTPWCFPLSPFSHSRFTGLQKGSLHFGPHDTQERRIVSHRLSYHVCPIRPCGAPSPRGEGYDTRIPSSKRRRATLVNPSAPPLRHPEHSRGIFLARPPYARMRPHSNDTLVLPFIAFLSLTFYRSAKRIPPLSGIALYKNRRKASHLGLQRRFLDFARNDDTTKTPRLSTRRSCYFKTYFTTSYDSFSFGAPKARDGLSFSVSSSFSRPSRPSVRSS